MIGIYVFFSLLIFIGIIFLIKIGSETPENIQRLKYFKIIGCAVVAIGVIGFLYTAIKDNRENTKKINNLAQLNLLLQEENRMLIFKSVGIVEGKDSLLYESIKLAEGKNKLLAQNLDLLKGSNQLLIQKDELTSRLYKYQEDIKQKDQTIEKLERRLENFFGPLKSVATQAQNELDNGFTFYPDATVKATYDKIFDLDRKQNYPELINVCELQIKQTPRWLLPYYYLGIAYARVEDKEKAMKQLLYFIDNCPADNVSEQKDKEGRPVKSSLQEAREKATEVIKMLRTNILELEASQNYPELIKVCNAEIKKDPKWLTPYFFLGIAYARVGEIDQAIQQMEFLVKNDPTNQDYKSTLDALKKIQKK